MFIIHPSFGSAEENMKKEAFFERLSQTRHELDAQLARFSAEGMENPLLDGGWSIKDLVAHIAWSEREMIPLFRDHALTGSPLWRLPTMERNRCVFEENQGRSLQDVLSEEKQLYETLLAILHELEDEDFNDPLRYKDMPPDWVPWEILDGSTAKHYAEHSADLARIM
jgi:uncharacterized damage-inducible protein DinB